MDEKENHLSSAAAFVEGGIQDACEDTCSICLEAFCESDPLTVTSCKHEFHLQCILEWCQRSSQCPMCWQSLSLKDPTSQELFEAVENERNIRLNQTRTTTLFHHPSLGDFELQHLPVGGTDADLEERIIQHLAAAAAMGRTHHIARRGGNQGRTGSHGQPQYLVFSTHPNVPASSARVEENEANPAIFAASPSSHVSSPGGEIQNQETNTVSSQVDASPTTSTSTLSPARTPAGQSTPVGQDRPEPSDFQSFSENLKSRLNAVSTRYKESITKSTRGWKERLFSRNSSVADIGSEVRREVNAGIATVSRMMERLDTSRRTSGGSASANLEAHSSVRSSNEAVTGNSANIHPNEGAAPASSVASLGPN